jgi:hypothetical protein
MPQLPADAERGREYHLCGTTVVTHFSLMKLLRDSVDSEFGARHELYEINDADAMHCYRQSHLVNANAGRASPISAWQNMTSMTGTGPDLVTTSTISAYSASNQSKLHDGHYAWANPRPSVKNEEIDARHYPENPWRGR